MDFQIYNHFLYVKPLCFRMQKHFLLAINDSLVVSPLIHRTAFLLREFLDVPNFSHIELGVLSYIAVLMLYTNYACKPRLHSHYLYRAIKL